MCSPSSHFAGDPEARPHRLAGLVRCLAIAVALAAGILPARAGAQQTLAAPGPADVPAASGQNFEWTLRVRFETAVDTRDARAQKSELVLLPELDFELPWDLSLKTVARLRFDAFDRLEPGRPSQGEVSPISRRWALGDHADFELRELYVQGSLGRALFTAGKQHIVWGKADGLKVLDLVNPQDFREFILADFEDSRIPLWALNLEIPVAGVTVQLVWVPDPTFHDVAKPQGLYAFTAPVTGPAVPPGLPVIFERVDRPSNHFSDSDAGLRLSTFFRGWDLTFNYFYHYDDSQVLPRGLETTRDGPVAVVRPTYRRSHVVGGSLANAFGDLTIRGELAYADSRFFSRRESFLEDGVGRTPVFRYVLGFDWHGLPDSLLSVQLFQSWLTEHDRAFLLDELSTQISFLARRTFRHETLSAQLFALYDLGRGDGFLRPRAAYDVRDDLRVWAGFDVFFGGRNEVFGQFGGLDRLAVGLEWTF